MRRIIKADLFRIFHDKTIVVLASIVFIYSVIEPIPIEKVINSMIGMEIGELEATIYGYRAAAEIAASGFINLVIPIAIVSVFTLEYSKKTIRNMASIHTISRVKIFWGKFIVFSVIVVGIEMVTCSIVTIGHTLFYGWGKVFESEDVLFIFLIGLLSAFIQVAYAGLTIIISTFIYKSAYVVLAYFIISIVESVCASIISSIITSGAISKYWLYLFPSTYMNSVDTIVQFPEKNIGCFASILLSLLLTIGVGALIYRRKDIIV